MHVGPFVGRMSSRAFLSFPYRAGAGKPVAIGSSDAEPAMTVGPVRILFSVEMSNVIIIRQTDYI
jgi:hypothetical protein